MCENFVSYLKALAKQRKKQIKSLLNHMYITSVIKQWHNTVAKLITVCRLTSNRKQISLLIDP